MAKRMDPILSILSILGYWAMILGGSGLARMVSMVLGRYLVVGCVDPEGSGFLNMIHISSLRRHPDNESASTTFYKPLSCIAYLGWVAAFFIFCSRLFPPASGSRLRALCKSSPNQVQGYPANLSGPKGPDT